MQSIGGDEPVRENGEMIMFCPECKSEYRAGFTRCADCDVELVDRLPVSAETHPEDEGLVTVFVSADVAEASLVKSLLEGSGLDVMLLDDNVPRIDSPVTLLIGGIKVAVPRHEQELALQVLDEYRGGAGQDPIHGRIIPVSLLRSDELGGDSTDEFNRDDEYRCPHCRVLLEAETTVCGQCGKPTI